MWCRRSITLFVARWSGDHRIRIFCDEKREMLKGPSLWCLQQKASCPFLSPVDFIRTWSTKSFTCQISFFFILVSYFWNVLFSGKVSRNTEVKIKFNYGWNVASFILTVMSGLIHVRFSLLERLRKVLNFWDSEGENSRTRLLSKGQLGNLVALCSC